MSRFPSWSPPPFCPPNFGALMLHFVDTPRCSPPVSPPTTSRGYGAMSPHRPPFHARASVRACKSAIACPPSPSRCASGGQATRCTLRLTSRIKQLLRARLPFSMMAIIVWAAGPLTKLRASQISISLVSKVIATLRFHHRHSVFTRSTHTAR